MRKHAILVLALAAGLAGAISPASAGSPWRRRAAASPVARSHRALGAPAPARAPRRASPGCRAPAVAAARADAPAGHLRHAASRRAGTSPPQGGEAWRRAAFPADDGVLERQGKAGHDRHRHQRPLSLSGREERLCRRYGVGVGRPGFEWAGTHKVTRKAEWPDWRPPAEMRKRQPGLPAFMPGGPKNPLGARALYLGSTLYRIHGSNEPWTIGKAVSSGCIRMRNEDVIDLYGRVGVGTSVRVI